MAESKKHLFLTRDNNTRFASPRGTKRSRNAVPWIDSVESSICFVVPPRNDAKRQQNLRNMTLKEAQNAVDEWIKTYGVRYFSELTNMALLTEEVGELARIIARTYGDQSFKESDKNRNMADEMADILWVLLCLANQTGVDLTEAFAKNMEKKTIRDRERHIHNDKLRDPIA